MLNKALRAAPSLPCFCCYFFSSLRLCKETLCWDGDMLREASASEPSRKLFFRFRVGEAKLWLKEWKETNSLKSFVSHIHGFTERRAGRSSGEKPKPRKLYNSQKWGIFLSDYKLKFKALLCQLSCVWLSWSRLHGCFFFSVLRSC